MEVLSKKKAIESINELSAQATPFLFVSDFSLEQNFVVPIDQIDQDEILYSINGFTNSESDQQGLDNIHLEKRPLSFQEYDTKFEVVHGELARGNTYLLNLTCQTDIDLKATLRDVFYSSSARYRLWFRDEFVVFSPEIFVQIKAGEISSFPMKGTIDARLPDAEKTILNSPKEMAEHTTIVDLIRNDMSIHARNVRVEKFRYVDHVKTNHKDLLQVSSKITGQLEEGFEKKLGEIIFSLLPAGSICGAPKNKTLKIIDEVEGYDRGYYTGVVGYFDGKNFDSGVMIRFIQKEGNKYVYKSGGGVHFLSDAQSEYQEMTDKVYVPVR